eukprot:1183484-Prorocentrum_minimum.AAC.5
MEDLLKGAKAVACVAVGRCKLFAIERNKWGKILHHTRNLDDTDQAAAANGKVAVSENAGVKVRSISLQFDSPKAVMHYS